MGERIRWDAKTRDVMMQDKTSFANLSHSMSNQEMKLNHLHSICQPTILPQHPHPILNQHRPTKLTHQQSTHQTTTNNLLTQQQTTILTQKQPTTLNQQHTTNNPHPTILTQQQQQTIYSPSNKCPVVLSAILTLG